MEEERQKHATDAEKMKRKQAKIQEEAAKKQEDADKVRNVLTGKVVQHYYVSTRGSEYVQCMPCCR